MGTVPLLSHCMFTSSYPRIPDTDCTTTETAVFLLTYHLKFASDSPNFIHECYQPKCVRTIIICCLPGTVTFGLQFSVFRIISRCGSSGGPPACRPRARPLIVCLSVNTYVSKPGKCNKTTHSLQACVCLFA